jgi:regulator of sirC expression with transglutaminase-like and TPR domain
MSFDALARQDDAHIDVALGAALVARDVYPEVDIQATMARFDELAAPLFSVGIERHAPEEQAELMNELIFGIHRFRGNNESYYDPRNSLLPDVLDRRLGVPLTLAIVYTEVARRVGVPARGVGFPGHFLVRIDRPGRAQPGLILDPFFGGRPVADDELRARLRRAFGSGDFADLSPHLGVASSRAILVRLLTNLKAIYLTRGERGRAHLALDRIVSLLPEAPGPLAERGRVAAMLGATESARQDLLHALTLHPEPQDARAISAELSALGTQTARPT